MALRLSTGLRDRMNGINTDMITNGSFTSATTGWTAVTSSLASAGSGYSGNCLEITESGSASPGRAYQDITTVVGRLYKISFYFKKGTADFGGIYVGTTGDEDAILSILTYSDAAWTQKIIGFVATATTTRITLVSVDATAGETSYFDEVVLHDEARSIQDIFSGGQIEVYTGTQPASADTAPSGTLLVTIKNGVSGVTFDDSSSGTIAKASGETWSGTVVGAGTQTAGWFRLVAPADPGTTLTTVPRIDGAVSTSGSQLNMSSVSFTNGATETISTFSITIPAS